MSSRIPSLVAGLSSRGVHVHCPCKPIALQLSNNKLMIDFESLKENDIFILEIISFTGNFDELAVEW